ncbi:response regulator transcription factor [Hymenobacter cellulosivorans]|uniref:Response regulator n=1 Tax=Hymenobacter cellulosivorans TaxID=2932249 RepID=A0ABY4F562_9BACT|nr:response regulator [Hymenobacter cellulosivorans]UOQ51705.1 response regulator [Hymenobacter cellulosivorans]
MLSPVVPTTASVLVVEDEFLVAHELQMILEQARYRVCGQAFSVAEARELLQHERPDIVLLDIYLQGEQTGLDLARHLDEHNIPFVFISAFANASLIEEAKATRPQGYLVKPFRPQDVLVTLEIAYHRFLTTPPVTPAAGPAAAPEAGSPPRGETLHGDSSAAARLAALFLELLASQFPVDTSLYSLKLKTPSDYAQELSVHVNHLNRAVRTATGKTTSQHITEKLISEAILLLSNTRHNVAEIAYCLGFQYPTYFNTFFKKQTGVNPLAYRS